MTKKAPVRKRLARTPMLRPGTYTADQVLEFVEGAIEAEPNRLRMKDWITMFKGNWGMNYAYQEKKPVVRRPACGTVACVAGWICTVTRVPGFNSSAAFDALGLTVYRPDMFDLKQDLSDLFWSTQLNARQVLSRLRRIRKQHKETLQNLTVEVK